MDAFFASDAFGEPVIVVGAAWEEDGGVRGELSALLPERTMRAIQDTVSPEDEDDEAEPWAASATLGGTSYEEAVGEDETTRTTTTTMRTTTMPSRTSRS